MRENERDGEREREGGCAGVRHTERVCMLLVCAFVSGERESAIHRNLFKNLR